MSGESNPLCVGGLVLCGGRSARMGQDKAWLRLGDEYLLQRVVNVVGSVTSPTVVVAARGQELPELHGGIEMAADKRPDRGPLEGLLAGMESLASRCDAVFVTGCDCPFLAPGLVAHLTARLGAAEVVLARWGGRLHPLGAVYRVSVLGRVRTINAGARRSLHALVEACAARVLEEDELAHVPGGIDNFTNVNTQGEYEAALRRLGRG